ncbi:S9 family peptidase [Canibacter zhoujuaniae]|uniref:S9 family peptidase n=1 Tax=Canibacter zhoujuaniae TaxID=2708343 RepID=UPI00141D9C56|nr:prolyl oligopeptidase family serine peptidase [Canibacter zhoujuaniae]
MSDNKSIFHDLKSFVAEPRFTGLFLSPDGERLIAARTELNKKKNGYVTALWELPSGEGESPRRLTRGVEGESLLGFTQGGDVLFTAKRDAGEEDTEQRLFLLPRQGGEARVVARRHAGFTGFTVARESGRIAFVSGVHPNAKDDDDDASIAKRRGEEAVTGILHTGYPVRAWDHDLGPTVNQVFVADPLDPADSEAQLELRKITNFKPYERLLDAVISTDGATVFATLQRGIRGTVSRSEVVAIDVANGTVTTVAAHDEHDTSLLGVSPTGKFLVITRAPKVSRKVSIQLSHFILDLASGAETKTFNGYTDWPNDFKISPDGREAYFTADHKGRGGIFHLDIATGTVTNLTAGKFHYAALCLNEQNGSVVALQDAIDQPPLPVRLDPETKQLAAIEGGIAAPDIPGTLTEFTTEAADGTMIRSWLCLPTDANADNQVPLLLWIHGGPFGSWNSWTWRWNPWTAVARGYAVLLPDPAISTGYGQEMLDRGWSEFGGSPFDDIMRCTHDALARPEIDADRKAALGGSYGGYMANWIAGQTGDFFDCIVTHASLWNLDQFRHTTDTASLWGAHLDDSHVAEYNPAAAVQEIVAPMLVIHGDKDYRVPIGEGLRLWFELLSAGDKSPEENPHRFLYFPNENHWILTPNNSVTWYATVFAFVDRHVKGVNTEYPELLG